MNPQDDQNKVQPQVIMPEPQMTILGQPISGMAKEQAAAIGGVTGQNDPLMSAQAAGVAGNAAPGDASVDANGAGQNMAQGAIMGAGVALPDMAGVAGPEMATQAAGQAVVVPAGTTQEVINQMAAEQVMAGQAAMGQAGGATGPVAGQPQVIMPGQGQAENITSGAATSSQVPPLTPNRKDNPSSTQATLLISELRDNVVIMKDGSFRAVVACKSINFDLMSEMEREGVEYSYQNFLNSLEFTTQILIRSQRVDIGPYLERLSEIRRNNDNMLLGVLMDDYINFIDVLSQEANIMDKSFFIIVPYYTSAEDERSLQQTKNFFKTFSRAKTPEVTKIDRATYDKALAEITNRIDVIISGLFQIGINSVRLNTKELAELYYNFNNPDTAVREPLVDFSKLATIYVKKGQKEENG